MIQQNQQCVRSKKRVMRYVFRENWVMTKVYTGDILAIGIGYWKDSKEHECKIEKLSI